MHTLLEDIPKRNKSTDKRAKEVETNAKHWNVQPKGQTILIRVHNLNQADRSISCMVRNRCSRSLHLSL